MTVQWSDILFHAAPTLAHGVAMGFMAAFGLRMETGPLSVTMVIFAMGSNALFSYLWTVREKQQHGGMLGGKQSRLEASIPAIVGTLAFVASTVAFWFLDI